MRIYSFDGYVEILGEVRKCRVLGSKGDFTASVSYRDYFINGDPTYPDFKHFLKLSGGLIYQDLKAYKNDLCYLIEDMCENPNKYEHIYPIK